MLRIMEFTILPIAWAGILLAALAMHDMEGVGQHSVCGPWGCGPPTNALLAIHIGWITAIWPDRVVKEAAHKDRSIAIAHDLEEQLWHEVEVTKTSKTGRVTTKTEWQPQNLSERQLNDIIRQVKERPYSSG